MYASNIVWVVVAYMSRLSLGLFLRRLSNVGLHVRLNIGLLTCCGAFGLLSFLLIAISPPYSRPWSGVTEHGGQLIIRWTVLEVLLSILDLATVVTATHIVWDLQMARAKKLRVVLLFALRLPLIALAGLHLSSLSYMLHHGGRYPGNTVETEIFSQMEVTWCLISATLPCLANFFRDTQTTLLDGGGTWGSIDGTHAATKGSSSGHHGMGRRDWELSSLRPAKSSARGTREAAADETSVKSDNSRREILRER